MSQINHIDEEQALGFLLRFLAIEGTTGNEEAITLPAAEAGARRGRW